MVNIKKVERKLPGLLINDSTGGCSSEYQGMRSRILQARHDPVFNSKFDRLVFALTEIDIYFDEKGNLATRRASKR